MRLPSASITAMRSVTFPGSAGRPPVFPQFAGALAHERLQAFDVARQRPLQSISSTSRARAEALRWLEGLSQNHQLVGFTSHWMIPPTVVGIGRANDNLDARIDLPKAADAHEPSSPGHAHITNATA